MWLLDLQDRLERKPEIPGIISGSWTRERPTKEPLTESSDEESDFGSEIYFESSDEDSDGATNMEENELVEHYNKELEHKDGTRLFALLNDERKSLRETNAFKILCEDLRNSVPPPTQDHQIDTETASRINAEVHSRPETKTYPSLPARITRVAERILTDLGVKEKAITPGHQRIRWKDVGVFLMTSDPLVAYLRTDLYTLSRQAEDGSTMTMSNMS